MGRLVACVNASSEMLRSSAEMSLFTSGPDRSPTEPVD
jgi:hypothetical protein